MAETERDRAEAALADAKRSRNLLERQLYLADMRLVQQLFEDGNIGTVGELLRKHLPLPGTRDLRGWEWFYWWNKVCSMQEHADCSLLVNRNLDWGFHCAAISRHGETAAIGHIQGGIVILDMPSRKVVRRLHTRSPKPVEATAFVCGDSVLVSTGGDYGLKRWNTDGWKPLEPLTISSPSSPCTCLATVSENAEPELLAAGTTAGQVVVWKTSSWKKVAALDCGQTVACLAFSPDGSYLAVGVRGSGLTGDDDTYERLLLWNVATWDRLPDVPNIRSDLLSLAFSPDGMWFTTGHTDRSIRLWNARTMQHMHSWDASASPVAIEFSTDSRLIAAGTPNDNAIRVWDVETRELLSTTRGHGAAVLDVTFLPHGDTLMSVGNDNDGIRFWTVADLRADGWAEGDYSRIVYADDGSSVRAQAADGTIHVLEDDLTGRRARVVDTGEHAQTALSNDGKAMAWLDSSGRIMVRQLNAPEMVHATTVEDPQAISALTVSDDGSLLAWNEHAHAVDKVVVYDCRRRSSKFLETDGDKPRVFLTFSPDNTLLYSPSPHCVWSVESGRLIRSLITGHARSGAFSPDGSKLALPGYQGGIFLFDTRTWRIIHRLTGHSGHTDAVAFSPNGKLLASGSGDYTVGVWDVESGELVTLLKGHKNAVLDVAFSPDSQTIVSCGLDGVIRKWSAASELEVKDSLYSGASAWFERWVMGYVRRGNLDTAIAICSKAITVNPDNAHVYALRGNLHAGVGDWDEAVSDFGEALRTGSQDVNVRASYAILLLKMGQLERYRQQRRELFVILEQDGLLYPNPFILAIGLGSEDEFKIVSREMEKSESEAGFSDTDEAFRVNRLKATCLSLAQYRLGAYRESLQSLSISGGGISQHPHINTMRILLTAMNECQLGNVERAREFLREAERVTSEQWPHPTDRLRTWWMWRSQVLCELLQHETETLIRAGD